MAKLRTCKICGKQYEYCGHCPSKNLIEPWRNLYCSENCRETFQIMGQYSAGKIKATEARAEAAEEKIKATEARAEAAEEKTKAAETRAEAAEAEVALLRKKLEALETK